MDLSDPDIAWLAGLLEGEGSFMMAKTKQGGKTYSSPRITVNMTDEDVIQRVATLFNTKVYTMPKYARDGYAPPKQQWRATLTGARAVALMEAMLPWMGERRSAKIAEILTEFSRLEPTELRRRRANSIAAAKRPRVQGRFVAS
jgi:hypothetical protein